MARTESRRMNPEGLLKGTALCFSVALLILLLAVSAGAEAIQDCHRVSNTYTDTKQENKSVVRLWQVETALPAVPEVIRSSG